MISCILFREILESFRVDFIRRPKGFIDFSFFFQNVARIYGCRCSHEFRWMGKI